MAAFDGLLFLTTRLHLGATACILAQQLHQLQQPPNALALQARVCKASVCTGVLSATRLAFSRMMRKHTSHHFTHSPYCVWCWAISAHLCIVHAVYKACLDTLTKTRVCPAQVLSPAETHKMDQHDLKRLYRRMQRLQDERIHLESLLAHERSLLAHQRSDNAELRSLLAQHHIQSHHDGSDQDLALLQHQSSQSARHQHQTHTHLTPEATQQLTTQQLQCGYSGQHSHQRLGFAAPEVDRMQHGQTQTMQLQSQLSSLQSQNDALRFELSAQQAENIRVTAQLKKAVMNRPDVSAWEAHAVQMEAEHEVVTSELQAVKEQLRTCSVQVLRLL